MTAKKYFFVFVAMVISLSVLSVAFNRVIDPFWYYRDISIAGLNTVKPKFRKYERHVKPSIVLREQPAALIFGSSFAEIGFDPLHPALRAKGKSYNFALAGAPWEMVSCDVWFALKNDAALRTIVLGIHPEAMPKKDCRADISQMETPEEREFLFSYNALEASINTVLEQGKQKPSHTLEGLYFYGRGAPDTAGRFREFFTQNVLCKTNSVSLPTVQSNHPLANKSVDISGLSDLVKAATKRGIEIKLVVYPRHALFFEQEYQCGTRAIRWNVLAQVSDLLAKETNNKAEMWDFEGYHDIGTENITVAPAAYWQDPGHFNYEFGNMMLDEMFTVKSPALGRKLTSDSIGVASNLERQNRQAFLSQHPDFLSKLDQFLPHH